jgi:hypothetical protein
VGEQFAAQERGATGMKNGPPALNAEILTESFWRGGMFLSFAGHWFGRRCCMAAVRDAKKLTPDKNPRPRAHLEC